MCVIVRGKHRVGLLKLLKDFVRLGLQTFKVFAGWALTLKLAQEVLDLGLVGMKFILRI